MKFIENVTIRKLVYGFQYTFHGNCCRISNHFSDSARYRFQIAFVNYPLHSSTHLGFLVGLCRNCLVCAKYNGGAIPWWKQIKLYVQPIEYRRVTHGQTDRQTERWTSHDGIVRAVHRRLALKRGRQRFININTEVRWPFLLIIHCAYLISFIAHTVTVSSLLPSWSFCDI